jgi:hypothetical protein
MIGLVPVSIPRRRYGATGRVVCRLCPCMHACSVSVQTWRRTAPTATQLGKYSRLAHRQREVKTEIKSKGPLHFCLGSLTRRISRTRPMTHRSRGGWGLLPNQQQATSAVSCSCFGTTIDRRCHHYLGPQTAGYSPSFSVATPRGRGGGFRHSRGGKGGFAGCLE